MFCGLDVSPSVFSRPRRLSVTWQCVPAQFPIMHLSLPPASTPLWKCTLLFLSYAKRPWGPASFYSLTLFHKVFSSPGKASHHPPCAGGSSVNATGGLLALSFHTEESIIELRIWTQSPSSWSLFKTLLLLTNFGECLFTWTFSWSPWLNYNASVTLFY